MTYGFYIKEDTVSCDLASLTGCPVWACKVKVVGCAVLFAAK